MKKLLFILFFFSLNFASFCQTKKLEIKKYNDGENSLWYKWQQNKWSQIGLTDLTKSADSLHIRFSTETQAVDIWTNDFKTFGGSLYNFAKQVSANNKNTDPEQEKVFSKAKKLKSSEVLKIYKFLVSEQIMDIPIEEKIKGWGIVGDGNTFIIEYSTPGIYFFKSYCEANSFRYQLKEAGTIFKLMRLLEYDLELSASFRSFVNKLPKSCYGSGGITMICNQEKGRNGGNL